MIRRPPRSTLFPYTTLSDLLERDDAARRADLELLPLPADHLGDVGPVDVHIRDADFLAQECEAHGQVRRDGALTDPALVAHDQDLVADDRHPLVHEPAAVPFLVLLAGLVLVADGAGPQIGAGVGGRVGNDGNLARHALYLPWTLSTVCSSTGSTTARFSRAPRGLPGRLTISVRPRMPAVPRDSMAVCTFFKLSSRIASPIPGISFSATSRVTSGTTSVGRTPVPPTVRTTSAVPPSQSDTSRSRIACRSSGTASYDARLAGMDSTSCTKAAFPLSSSRPSA